MKKNILSAIAGAAGMLLLLIILANVTANKERPPEEYIHIDYVSATTPEACYICGSGSGWAYWGQDNVGLLDLNTFDLMYIGITRYDAQGNLITEPAGYRQTCHMFGSDTTARADVFPDNGYACVQLTGIKYAIDRRIVQDRLCQSCLDSINSMFFLDRPPAEYAVVSFSARTVQPLLDTVPWFAAGNYGIDCEFRADGGIDLLIHDCLPRYMERGPAF